MIGTTLGRYRVEAELGRGGMSVVYRAHDPVLGRKVALKVLHPHLADRPESRERFTREARAVARLAHPNIVEVYDYSPPEAERAYIVTEYIDGPTLRAFVEDHPVLRAEAAALVLIPVFDALDHAHRAGVVHRDVKPENIMLRPDGSPVLMDFGIAQMVDMETLTATGTILGSPAHMAPEVVEGEEAGPPADVFSAGTVLYWLVCGALPFSGPNPAALFRRILESRFDPVLQRRPHAGRTLARLIEHCLQRAPDKRPSGAREVADALRSMLGEGGLTDLPAERAAYVREPEVYQEALARRLVPAYLAAARRALDAGATARGLDFLDRVMAVDEAHPEAQALLARVERGQRRSRLARRGGLAVTAAAALGALAALLRMALDEPPRAPDAGLFAQASVARPVPDLPDAGLFDAGAVGQREVARPRLSDAGPDVANAVARAAEDAGSPTVAVHHPHPRVVAPPPSAPPPDAGPPPAPVPITLRAYPPTLQVFVDGVLHGNVSEVNAGKRIALTPGTHELRFQAQGCQDGVQPVTVLAGQKPAPVVFRCTWKPASIQIQSNRPAEIRNEASGQVLGQTNQKITFPMSDAHADLALTIWGPEGSVKRRRAALDAGKPYEATVDF